MLNEITLTNETGSRYATITIVEGEYEVACFLRGAGMARAFGNSGLKSFKTVKGAYRAANKFLAR